MYCVLHGVRGIIAIVRNERGNCAVLLSIIAGRIVRTDQKATSAFKSQEANGIPKQWRVSCLYSCNGKLRNRNRRNDFRWSAGSGFPGSSEGNERTFRLFVYRSSILPKCLASPRHSNSEKRLETIFDRLSDVECFKHKPGVQVVHGCRITKGISHCVWCKMRGESSRALLSCTAAYKYARNVKHFWNITQL